MSSKKDKIYPNSGVELSAFTAKNYDNLMNIASLGFYRSFIHRAIRAMDIKPGDKILDLGCGAGRNTCIMEEFLGDTGKITGMDISPIMEKQFKKKCAKYHNAKFIKQRIDLPFSLSEQFDKIFISFVIHGFPHNSRKKVIENVYNNLKPGGLFLMLDFAEFNMRDMPLLYRFAFKTIECKYAFDFIKRDWKQILGSYNFTDFKEIYLFKKYVRLLKAKKLV
jgi:demethylmenaquinone methyltransferase/2-methoxy-6-polyprenyl-1,4-benzoquinol methylase